LQTVLVALPVQSSTPRKSQFAAIFGNARAESFTSLAQVDKLNLLISEGNFVMSTATMSSATISKVNAAVRECLDQCYPSPQPLATLAAYLIKLSSKPDWKQEEIDAVEAGVVRMLAVLSSPSDSGIIPAGLLNPSSGQSS
jgi:hypothetical protein